MRLPILVLLLRSAQPQFHAQTSIFVDAREVIINANLLQTDLLNVGKQACDELHIGEPQGELRDGRPRCATLIADELAESIFCNVSARGALEEAMREKGLEGPRGAFRGMPQLGARSGYRGSAAAPKRSRPSQLQSASSSQQLAHV